MINKKTFIIIPNCSDLNRGDQALVWETKRIAEESGYIGDYYLTTEKNEPVNQSIKHGLNIIQPIIEHPSRKFKSKKNIEYNLKLKLKWGLVAILDFIISLLLLNKVFRYILIPFFSKSKKESIEKFKESDAVFMKVGGLIHAYGGITATYYIYFALYHIYFSSSLGKKIFIMPNSFGPFDGPFVQYLVRKAFKKCELVTTRETFSQKMIYDKLNIKVKNYPDLAFFLPNGKIDKQKILKGLNIPNNRKIVALTMRPHRFPQSSNPQEAYNQYKKELAKFVEWLFNENYMPVLVEHTLAINAHENDSSCIKDVIKYLKEDHFCYYSNEDLNCYELKTLYSCFDYIVGTRFHSFIFSISNNIPGIAIAYAGNKGQGIMNDIELSDLVISIDQVSCDKLTEKFNFLISNEKKVLRKIFNYNKLAEKNRNNLISNLIEK